MAISAGSALLSAVGTGFTATGFVTAGSMFIGGTMLTHFLASTAIGAAINALTPKPTTPGAAGYTVTARGSNLDHQIIYGQTRVAGAVVADFLSGEGGSEGTRFLHRVQVMAGHEVESYEEVYVNSYKVTEWKANTSAGGVGAVTGITDLTPWYNDPDAVLVPTKLVEVAPDGTETEVTDIDYSKWNALAMQFWTGADDQTASTRLIGEHPDNKWTSDHRLRGRAYMYIRMGRDADGDNFPTGVPEITAVIKGRKVYDPREVSHDPDDKSTWQWSDNPALCIRDYLTQDFGLGEKDIQVDDDLVETAANVCDQTADDGSTRYTCNGAFTTGIQPYDLLNSILTSMGGLLWYAQGQWRMKPAYWTAPTESFSEDDFRSAISVSTRHSRKDNFNTVEGTFRGPKSNYALTTFPAVDSAASITADGGTVSKIDLEMPFTDTPEEARRIARIVLERNRQQLTVRASFGLKAFRVQVGDVVNLSLERFGWVNKTFEVTEWSFGNVDQYDIQIELTLREITESVFDEVDDGVTFELDNANVPSPLAGLTVGNLSVITNGFFSTDGTFINNLLVNWDAPVNSNVAEYAVEWRIDNFDYAANGGIVTLGTSPTNREVFVYQAYEDVLFRQPDQDGFDFYNTGGGSTLTEQEIRAQLEASAEGVAARSYVISGAKVNGTANEYNIYPVRDDEIYSVRVRAINDFGAASRWAAATVDASKDVTAPNAPTSLSATGGIQSVSLSWIAPTTNTDGTPFTDFREYIVYGGTSSSPTTEIGRTAGRSFTHAGLLDDTTYYYRVKAVDYSGNESAYSTQDSATTDAEIVGGASVLVVYADSAAGANQSLTPGSRRYVQYVEYTGTAPSLPVSGTFVLFVGSNGQSVWPIYADDASGSGQSFSPTGKAYVTFYEALTQPFLPVSGQTFVKYEGEDGVSSIQIIIFRRSSSTPSTPSGGSYNFDTSTLSAPSGWSDTVPTGTDPIYASVGKATVLGGTGTDSSITWSTPRLFVQNGEDGQIGPTGPDGDRGAGRWHVAASPFSLPTNSTGAQNVWNYNVAFAPVVDDQAWFYTGTISNPTSQAVFICSSVSSPTSHTWTLQDEVVDGNLLVTGTVTTDKIDANAITADKIDTGAITTDKLDAGAVTAVKIDTGAITTDKLDAGAVTASKVSIGNGTLTADGSGNLVIGTVTSNELGSGSVTSVKIASNLESDNYVLNTSGWQIDRVNGDAEFNDVIVRGELVAGDITITGTFDGPDAITEGTITNAAQTSASFGTTGNGTYQNELNLTLTFDAAVDVFLFWDLIFDISASGSPEWGYRVRYGGTASSGGTTVYARSGFPAHALGAEEHHSGLLVTALAAGTYTFRLDSWGTSGATNVDESRFAVLGRMI